MVDVNGSVREFSDGMLTREGNFCQHPVRKISDTERNKTEGGRMRILVVEDNRYLSHELKMGLLHEGYAVDCAFDGEEGQALAEMTGYDVIVLDILLPGKDGLAVCRDLRQRRLSMPVLLLTARDLIEDRVRGLDSGADDYLVKPFALAELLARVRALLRRATPQKEAVLSVADLVLDPAKHHVERAQQPIELSARLFSVLEFLILLLYSGLLYSTLLKMLPLSLTSPQAQQIGFQFILIGLAILLVVAISGYWLAAHAMRPVRLMTQTAERIGQANLNERLQIKGRDELSELAEAFNAMLARVEQ